MKKDIYQARHILHQHNSAKFLRGTPRTFREAFGHSWLEESHHSSIIWILVAVAVAVNVVFYASTLN